MECFRYIYLMCNHGMTDFDKLGNVIDVTSHPTHAMNPIDCNRYAREEQQSPMARHRFRCMFCGALDQTNQSAAACPTSDFALNLPNAEVRRRCKRLYLADYAPGDRRTSQMLSSCLSGPHAGGHALTDE